jgi:glycyl-tRNA synthetase
MLSFQEMINVLSNYWASHGCAWHQGYDLEVGAGTFNPVTFLRCLGPEPYKAVYVEPSRRPQDGRYGQNPNRVQFYHQMQVIFKPSPENVQELYLGSLEKIGLDLSKHDIRFVHDDWENPTIGASGLGWEVWVDGMEVTQFTYFQSVGGLPVRPVTAEITYGLERLAMYLQQVDSCFDVQWTGDLSYGDIYQNSEWQWSHYNFEASNSAMWQRHFEDFEEEAKQLILKNLPIPAYDFVMKASHAFNMLDARGTISVSERARIMGKIRALAHDLAVIYIQSREQANFPLLKKNISTPMQSTTVSSSIEFNEGETRDFLLEIGSEELPANAIEGAIRSLAENMRHFLAKYKLSFTEIVEYATPRRLAIFIKGLSAGVKVERIEKKGPSLKVAFDSEGILTQAGKGFFRSLQLEEKNLEEVQEDRNFEIRGDYLYAFVSTKAISTHSLLAENLEKVILSIDFPKKMRWGSFDIEYARPFRWFVALYGKEVVSFSIATITSGRCTQGHRFKANTSISLTSPHTYEQELEKHFVIPSMTKRKESILEQITALEKKMGLHALAKEELLTQVANLVEWPEVVLGNFDQHYLQAPKDVLVSEMVEHQRYFPLEKEDHTLAPHFLAFSNNGSSDLIAHGHQKAISSRLADGLFLYEEDLKEPLSYFAQKLTKVTFHKELGSMATKQKRLGELALLLHNLAPIADKHLILHAASLCKADLTTQLVGEFPHLQGIIGGLYARHQNEENEVALAIEEHWLPKQEKGPLPQTGLGKLLSLADKIDNLLSCFALQLKPTSSSDPFALRRQAFGLIKILIEENVSIDLPSLLEKSFDVVLHNPELTPKNKEHLAGSKKQTVEEIMVFLEGRMRSLFVQMSFSKDKIEATLSYGLNSPYDSYLQLEALHRFAETSSAKFGALLEIHTRTKKILHSQKPELLSKRAVLQKGLPITATRFHDVNERLLVEKAEKDLSSAVIGAERRLSTLRNNYGEALELLANLQPVVTEFFDTVIVITEQTDLSLNRLALLQKLFDLFEELFDFNKLHNK